MAWRWISYLSGIKRHFLKSGALQIKPEAFKAQSLFSRVAQGFMVEFSNPKAVLYFTAVLPQFLDLSRPLVLQLVIMVSSCIVMQWLVYCGYAMLGDKIARSGIKPLFLNIMNKTLGAALLFVAYEMSRVKTS